MPWRSKTKRRCRCLLEVIPSILKTRRPFLVLAFIFCLTNIVPSLQPLQDIFIKSLTLATLILTKQIVAHLVETNFQTQTIGIINGVLNDGFNTFMNALIYALLALLSIQAANNLLA